MLRFQRALLAELLLIFVGVLGVVTAVIFAGITLRLVGKGQGSGMGLLLELLPSLLPLALSFSLPFAWLAAVTMVLGRWVADHEIMALRSAGLHLRAVALPVLALGALLTAFTVYLGAYEVPDSQQAMRAGVRRYLPMFLSSLRNVDRTVTLNNGRFSFSHYADGAFHDVELDRRKPNGALEMKVMARRVTIRRATELGGQDALQFQFEDAFFLHATASGEPAVDYRGDQSTLQMGSVKQIGMSVLFNEFFGTRRFMQRPRDMDLPDLAYASQRGGVWRGSPYRVEKALHGRLALGFAPFVLGLFATAVALLLPATGRRVRDFLLGFLPPVLLYFPIYLAAHSTGGSGTVPVWTAMWSANLVVGGLGFLLLAWAYRR